MKVISVIHDEFKTIAGSYAILLVLMGGIFVYGLLYNYMSVSYTHLTLPTNSRV